MGLLAGSVGPNNRTRPCRPCSCGAREIVSVCNSRSARGRGVSSLGDEVVNTDRVRAPGEQAPVGAALALAVEQLDPQNDPALLHRVLELGGMPRDQPMGKSGLQSRGAGPQPRRKALSDRAGGTADPMHIARKRQVLGGRRRGRHHDGGRVGKHTLQAEATERFASQAFLAQVLKRVAQAIPRVEHGDSEPQLGFVWGQAIVHV